MTADPLLAVQKQWLTGESPFVWPELSEVIEKEESVNAGAVLERIRDNALAWHGQGEDGPRRALDVIAVWCIQAVGGPQDEPCRYWPARGRCDPHGDILCVPCRARRAVGRAALYGVSS